jgi:AcrR family transcriptional regulator
MTRSHSRRHGRPDRDRRETPADERRAARRAQLLDDAIEAIREVGSGATMEQLAGRGGVTKPILYRHFRDRDGIITAVADRFSSELLGEIDTALHSSLEPRELLAATVDAYLAFLEREPALYRFLLRQVGVRPDNLTRISPLVDAIARRVALVIGEHLRAVGQDSGPAVPWAYGIVGLVHQAGDWWLEDRTLPRERLTAYLTVLLWEGLDAAANATRTASPKPRP